MLLLVVVLFAAPSAALLGATFQPRSGSPMARGVHPRLHITRDNLGHFRDKVGRSISNGGVRENYQTMIDWLDGEFGNSTHDNAGFLADYFAVVGLLGPISGINYHGRSAADFGNKAVSLMMSRSSSLPNEAGSGYGWHDSHQTMARAYDWSFDILSSSQKTQIVRWLKAAGQLDLEVADDTDALFSSRLHEMVLPWYAGLAFWGDGVDDAAAAELVDSFDRLMLHGRWLDAANWVARQNGGASEVGNYHMWHNQRWIVQLDGWRTATGVNYFVEPTALTTAAFTNFPHWVAYYVEPSKPNHQWRLFKVGQTKMSQPEGIRVKMGRETLISMGEALRVSSPRMGRLNRWLLENRMDQYGDISRHAWATFAYVVFGDRSLSAQSPADLGLPLTGYFDGLGRTVMRTGFDSFDDTALVVMGPPYQLSGHAWFTSQAPRGFHLSKYGSLLVFMQTSSHGPRRANLIKFRAPNESAGFKQPSSFENILSATAGSRSDIRGTLRQASGPGWDYVFTDNTKRYDDQYVSNATRQYVYLRPQSRTNSDYIVIFDRTAASLPAEWEVISGYRPETRGGYVVVSNNIDPMGNTIQHTEAHGRVFIKPLLPLSPTVDIVGGPGYQFTDDYQGNEEKEAVSSSYFDGTSGAFYTGAYATRVSGSGGNFLHVLQTADANRVDTMVDTDLIVSEEGKLQGAFIESSAGQTHAVTMFAKNETIVHLGSGDSLTYTYGLSGATGATRHVITDMNAVCSYEVVDFNASGTEVSRQTLSTSDTRTRHSTDRDDPPSGTLVFTTTLTSGGSHRIEIVPTGEPCSEPPADAPPSPPTNLRVTPR